MLPSGRQMSMTSFITPLLITHYSLLITHYSLLITHYSLLITHYSLLITHYSLLITHYSLVGRGGGYLLGLLCVALNVGNERFQHVGKAQA